MVVPFIDFTAVKTDITCSFEPHVKLAHSILYVVFLLGGIAHALLVLVGVLPEPKLQQSVKLTLTPLLNREPLAKFIGGFLEVVLVTYWGVFLGPEPLDCFIDITAGEFSGFQGGRVGLMIGIGAVLLGFIMYCNYKAKRNYQEVS